MYSPIYRYVANRSNFCQGVLSSSVEFVPVKASDAATSVREMLKLDVTNSDFFIAGVAGALLGSPQLMANFDHRSIGHPKGVTVVGYSSFKPPLGVTLVGDNFGTAQVHRIAETWPIDQTLTLTRIDAQSAMVEFIGEARKQVVSAVLIQDILSITWPAWTGLKGNLQFTIPDHWQHAASFQFNVEPSEFPYALAMTALKQGVAWMNLLEPVGLLPIYAGVQSSVQEGMGVIALGLALDTISRL
jgi:hypothetical protein